MFTVVDKDILEAEEDYICHQTNCVSIGPAAGLARSIFTKYPFADVYIDREKPDQPGTIIVRESDIKELTARPIRIVNMMGQYYPGGAIRGDLDTPLYEDGYMESPHIRDDAKMRIVYFRHALYTMSETLPFKASYAFPWTIGCGIAGGDWGKYIEILKSFEEYIEGNVVIYKLPKRN